MLRALSGGSSRMPDGGNESRWQMLRAQYRRMTQAIRFGDLSEAQCAYDEIRRDQAEPATLSRDAWLAFDALGDAIESGSLADASDGLRLFRLVLEGSGFRSTPPQSLPDEDRPSETLRSGVMPIFVAAVGEELPETATIPNIDVSG